MPDASTLSDQELNRAIAEALGWRLRYYDPALGYLPERDSRSYIGRPVSDLRFDQPDRWECWGYFVPDGVVTADTMHNLYAIAPNAQRVEGGWEPVDDAPRFASSIDAVKQAEEKLREAGWTVEIQSDWYEDDTDAVPWVACWYAADGSVRYRKGALNEARARAEACLAALLALAGSEVK